MHAWSETDKLHGFRRNWKYDGFKHSEPEKLLLYYTCNSSQILFIHVNEQRRIIHEGVFLFDFNWPTLVWFGFSFCMLALNWSPQRDRSWIKIERKWRICFSQPELQHPYLGRKFQKPATDRKQWKR